MSNKQGVLKNIEIPIYNIIINVIVDKDCNVGIKSTTRLKKEFYKRSKKHFFKGALGMYVYSEKNNIHSIILSKDAGAGVIAHECFHAIMTILQLKGIKYSQKSEECFAYILGYLVEEVTKVKKYYNDN